MRAKIKQTKLPETSILNTSQGYDYVDSFQGTYDDYNKTISSTVIGKSFFTSGPKWVGKLFNFRNKVVSVFGLKTSGSLENREEQLKKFHCQPGERLGLFQVYEKNDNEVILGEDDKHLNFRISLLKEDTNNLNTKTLTISTTVKFNNLFGRIYFAPVKPFHKIIVPKMLKAIICDIEKMN